MDEGPPEVPDRFPDRVVQKGTAAADAAMQLSRDIAGLFFHPIGIVLPYGEQAVEVIPRNGKDVDGGTDARPPTLMKIFSAASTSLPTAISREDRKCP